MSGSAYAGTIAERHRLHAMSPANTVLGALASAPGRPLLPLDKDLHGSRQTVELPLACKLPRNRLMGDVALRFRLALRQSRRRSRISLYVVRLPLLPESPGCRLAGPASRAWQAPVRRLP